MALVVCEPLWPPRHCYLRLLVRVTLWGGKKETGKEEEDADP